MTTFCWSMYKIPVSVLVVIHTPDMRVLLLERADHPGYWQSVTGSQNPERNAGGKRQCAKWLKKQDWMPAVTC